MRLTPLQNKRFSHPPPGSTAHTRGFTLVELMIGIVVGMIVVAGVIALYITVIRGSAFVVTEARVMQDTRIPMDFIANDLRRAGYSHPSRLAGPMGNPFMEDNREIAIHDFGGSNNNCILFSYDPTFRYDPAGGAPYTMDNDLSDLIAQGDQFIFGFRHNPDDGTIQMLVDPTVVVTTSCADGRWEDLNDPGTTNVTDMAFTSEGSTCLNVNSGAPDPTDDEAGAGATGFCADYYGAGVESGEVNTYIESRQVRIELSAQDSGASGTTVDFDETVRVRNNRIFARIEP